MKKVISVILCALLLLGSFSVFACAEGEETTEATTEATTEFVLSIDVNERYTDFVEDSDAFLDLGGEDNKSSEGNKTLYIALLCAALVVAVVILAVTLKRVPKEEDIDISGSGISKKGKKE